MAETASPQVGAARAGPRPLVVSPGCCAPSSLLLALWVFWQNRIFAIFSGIFPENRISAQKRDTRAILLKTALVRVSCIQNTQIRGETIAKLFGKVDTFWTYQLLDMISENTSNWDLDKDNIITIVYGYDCVKNFYASDVFEQ
jgi:hypothetical protein